MTRIEQEKDTIFQMIKIYCHGKKHCHAELCDDCSALLDYAYARLEHCKFGEKSLLARNAPFTVTSRRCVNGYAKLCAMPDLA